MRYCSRVVFFLPLWILFLALSANAQTSEASLSGFATDSSGAVLVGTHITLSNRATGAMRTAVTGSDGSFHFLALSPGDYRLRASHASFEASEVRDLELHVSDQRELIIHLKPGSVHTVVTVTDSAALSTDSSVSTTIDRQFVENMPLNGRTFQNLIELAPGVVPSVGGPGQFTVNGLRATENYFTIDGVSANVGMSSTPSASTVNGYGAYSGGSIPGFNAWGGTNSLMSVDSMEEFKVDTADSSGQFGRGLGGQVQIRSRAGTNSFHGSASEFLRNEIFSANDWFNKHNTTSAGVWSPIGRQKLRLNDFGGTLGGPIFRGKLFFFGTYEGMRVDQPSLVSAYGVVPRILNQLSGTMLSLAKALPVGTGTELTNYAQDPTNNTYHTMPMGLATYTTSTKNLSTMNGGSLRIDYTPKSNLTFFGRMSTAPTYSGSQSSSQQSLGSSNIKFVTLGATITRGASFSNDLRLNLSQNQAEGYGDLVSVGGSTTLDYSQVGPAGYNQLNSTVTFNLSGTRYSLGSSTDSLMRQINLTDSASVSFKRHTISIGDDFRYLFPRYSPAQFGVTYSFASPAFMTGFTTTATYTVNGVTIPAGTIFPQGTLSSLTYQAGTWLTTIQTGNAAYVTDNWRATSRLTLNLGLRWEVNPAPHGTSSKPLYTLQGWTVGSSDYSNLSLAPGGTPIYATRWTGISPRVGFAYVIHAEAGHATVLRGAYSRETSVGSIGATGSASTFPYTRSGTLYGPAGYLTYPVSSSILQPAAVLSLAPPYGTGQQFTMFDPNYRIPYAHQESVSIQQEFGRSTSLTVGYVGTNGRDLLRRFVYQVPFTGASVNFGGDNIYVSSNAEGNADYSNYSSLQTTLQHRLTNGLQFLATYVWSHAIDTGSQDIPVSPQGSATLSTNNSAQLSAYTPASQRGPADSDRRNRFTAVATYMIPTLHLGDSFGAHLSSQLLRGWGIAPTVTIQSGAPIDVYYLRYISSSLSTDLQPDVVQGQPMWIADSTVIGGRRLNAAAYSIPTTQREGTAPRNAAVGFAHYTFDSSVYRDIKLYKTMRLRARADIFNVFNHPNFPDPNGYLGYLGWNYNTNTQGAFTSSANFGSLGSLNAYAAPNSLATAQAGNSGLAALFQSSSPRTIQLSMKLEF